MFNWRFWNKQALPIAEVESTPIVVPAVLTSGPGCFEKNSPTWIFLRHWLAEELEILRKQNDKPLSPDQTAELRGKIKFCKRLLTGPEIRPKSPATFAGKEFLNE